MCWCLLGFGCAVPAPMDLSQNPALYRDTGYRSKVPADRVAFMTPVADRRGAMPVEADTGYPVQMLSDAAWAQSGPGMIDAIVRRELAASGVFAGMETTVRADGCVVQVTLERFDAGLREVATGRQSLAAVQLRIRVHGPASATGQRQVLVEQAFADEAQSEVTMRPASPRLLLGVALRSTMATMLAFLDQSNVARANVPLGNR